MDSSLLDTGGLSRQLRVKVEPGDVEPLIEGELLELQKKTRLKGFRPGKVPLPYLRRMAGSGLLVKALEKVLEIQAAKLGEDQGLRIVGQVSTDVEGDIAGVERGESDLTVVFSFEVMPTFSLRDLPEVEIEKPVQDEADLEARTGARIAELVQYARRNDVKPVDADRPAEQGDLVRFAFDSLSEPGGAVRVVQDAEGRRVTLRGLHELILPVAAEDRQEDVGGPLLLALVKRLDGRIEGLKRGDAFEFEFTPEEGRPTWLRARVTEICLPVYSSDSPDEEILEGVARGCGLSVQDLRARVTEDVRNEFDRLSLLYVKKGALDVLDREYADMELPEKLLREEAARLVGIVSDQSVAQVSGDPKETCSPSEAPGDGDLPGHIVDLAKRRLRTGFVIDAIARRDSVVATQDQIARSLMEMAHGDRKQAEDIWVRAQQDAALMRQIQMPGLEENVLSCLLEGPSLRVVERVMSQEGLEALYTDQSGGLLEAPDGPRDQRCAPGEVSEEDRFGEASVSPDGGSDAENGGKASPQNTGGEQPGTTGFLPRKKTSRIRRTEGPVGGSR